MKGRSRLFQACNNQAFKQWRDVHGREPRSAKISCLHPNNHVCSHPYIHVYFHPSNYVCFHIHCNENSIVHHHATPDVEPHRDSSDQDHGNDCSISNTCCGDFHTNTSADFNSTTNSIQNVNTSMISVVKNNENPNEYENEYSIGMDDWSNHFIQMLELEVQECNLDMRIAPQKVKTQILKKCCEALLKKFNGRELEINYNDPTEDCSRGETTRSSQKQVDNFDEPGLILLNSQTSQSSPSSESSQSMQRPSVRIMLSMDQRHRLLDMFHCSSSKERKYFLRSLNYALENGPRGQLTNESRQIIIEWLKAHNYRAPNVVEQRELKRLTGLNLEQIRAQVAVLTDPVKRITPEKRQIIMNWLEKNAYRPMNSDDRQELIKLTGLNYRQIYDFGRRFTMRPGVVDSIAKEIIREWMETHTGYPTSNEYNDLIQKTNLNKEQIRTQIRQWKVQKVNSANREIILRWWYDNKKRNPTIEERETLSRTTNLTRRQITNILYYARTEKGVLTDEKKSFVEKWLASHDYQTPNQEELDQLQQQTQLSRKQVYRLCKRIITKKNKM